MLFKRDMDPRCAYCKRGAPLDAERIICAKKGIVSCAGSCPAFRYDPLKRVPPRPASARFEQLKDEDFTL